MTVSQVREALDGAELLDWARTCRTDLELRRAEIDALNVFPIADSDTGTNLLATMRAAVAAAERAVPDAARPDRTAGRAVPMAADPGIGDDSATGGYPDADAGPATAPGDDGGAPVGRGRAPIGAADVGDRRAGAEVPAHLVAQALARGATTGARGNSGIILSQVLRGIAEAVVGGPLTGERLRTALRRAAVLVRTGLSAPVEGTILTVLDRAAVAAAGSAELSLVSVAQSAAEGAARALNETPAQLGVLRAAGVVDAGARGLLVLLDSLVTQVCGQAPARDSYLRADRSGAAQRRSGAEDHRPEGERPGDLARSPAVDGRERPAILSDARTTEADSWDGHRDSPDPHFEVMYVISGTDEAAAGGLRDRLAVLGDSVVVVGDGDSTWSAHVHCRDAGAAIEAGLAIGTVTGIRIESFAVTAPHGGHAEHLADAACDGARADGPRRTGEVVAAQVAGAADAGSAFPHAANTGAAAQGRPTVDGGSGGPEVNPPADRGILAVASGAAAARLFEDAGAVVLRGDRQLDTTALLTAIRAMPNREVLVLPNGALPAQELVAAGVAARDGSRDVLLLPSASMVQGLAALAVHDRGRIAVDDAFAMSEAAATTRWGALRPARVRALTMVGMCSPGDGLGLVGQDVVVIDPDVVGAGRILLDRMLGLGGELVTLLMGADAGPELGAVLAEHVTAGFPGVEVVVYSGGQQADLVQIGVE
ncbi:MULTISPECIES: DAK2 domain-containing protein [unclassified Nocardia]|uniref:DAK2 domain-containing protein n=1 Tax=unclassified Nocardia TaxID=2637762 RepID=UPI00369F5D0C